MNSPLPPPPPGTAASIALREIVALARHRGLAVDAALRAAGLDEATLGDLAGWIPLDRFERVLAALIDATGDDSMPLKLASQAQPGTFGLVSFIAMVAPTMAEVIERAIAFERLLGDFASTRLEPQGDNVMLVWDCRLRDARVRRAMTEGVIAAWTVYARWLLNDGELAPLAVQFEHAAPTSQADLTLYQRIFSAPVHFDQPQSGLLLPAEFLTRPLRQPDPVLFRTLDAHARQRLAGSNSADDTAERVAAAIRACIADEGVPSREAVAARLGVNPRTLLRRLREQDTNYQTLLDDVRREQALELARDPAQTPAAIATQLGFGDVRSLQRCFRRWTGKTIGEFRTGVAGATP